MEEHLDDEPPMLSQPHEFKLEEKGKTIPCTVICKENRTDMDMAKIISDAIDQFGADLEEKPTSGDVTFVSQWHTLINKEGEPVYFETTEEVDCQETQTSIVDFHDAETDTENTTKIENKKEKLKKLAITVFPGVNILPCSEEKEKKTRKHRGNMKTCAAGSVHIEGKRVKSEKSLTLVRAKSEKSFPILKRTEAMTRRRAIPEKIKYPQTFAQVGADFGFPSAFSISDFIGNIAAMKWPLSHKGDVVSETETSTTDKNQPRRIDENNNVVGSENSFAVKAGESGRLVDTAFNIINAGLKYGYDLIGAEAELEPKEDFICYNGYKIKVFGKRLLLESVHLNCDFSIDSNGIWCRKNPSFVALKPTSMSRAELEQNCEGRRVRVVIRVAGSLVQDAKEVSSIMMTEHSVRHTDGKWSLIFGNTESRNNFIEISCPTGVHPESLAYGLVNGLLLIDAP